MTSQSLIFDLGDIARAAYWEAKPTHPHLVNIHFN